MRDYSALWQCHMGPQVSARLQCTVIPPLLSYTPVAMNQAARLMHSFITFQGQVLHLVQGDTCLFNYVDNLITFYSQGPRLRVWGGSPFRHGWELRAWNLHQGMTLALLKSGLKCYILFTGCILSCQPSYIRLLSWVVTQLVYYLWYFATLHSDSGSCFPSVKGY